MNIHYNKKAIKLLGKKIKRIREEQNLSQAQLAFETGSTQKQISLIELGKINTSIAQILSIAQVLNIPVKDLFDF